ncbi:MAG TPA: 3-isopropylmalate dehydratase small subunit [Rhizomicrobium sp.]|jgi:3-isopropylmalate/(R)-2-methylmalate dehydratase small subunit|nr:3-isopropylmalate dehydratase small subunit [Rhizomicrobium sp.]
MADPFQILNSRTVVLTDENIDTDQIIPARFLTTTAREGLGRLAFHDWRYDAEGRANGTCVLNRIAPCAHRILVAGRNFGCGSSREHAPWALTDFGFRAVVSTEIADIFTSNALKNGLLPVVVDQATWDELASKPGGTATIDLESCELRFGNHVAKFQVESFARRCLLDGVDTLGWLMGRLPQIEKFEGTFVT